MRHPAAASAMAAFAAVAIAACSGGPGGVSPRLDAPNRRATTQWDQISIYAPGGTVPAEAITDGVGGPDAMAMDASGNLYVANVNTSTVTVYARGAASPSRTITSGIGIPVCLAVDSKGDLFVASATGGPGSRGKVTEYAPGGRTVIRRIDATVDTAGWHDGQRGLVVDNAGNLYAASTPFKGIASVEVFRPNETKPSRVITEGVVRPWNLAFDRLGNLYVLNGWYGLSIYAPGSSSPFAQIDEPSGTIAFDYGPKTIRCGGGLDEAEAGQIVELFKQRSGRLRGG